MFKKYAPLFLAAALLSACASNQPRVVQTSPSATEIRLTAGLATQIELPESDRVQSVVIGKPSLVSADQSGSVVNLTAKEGGSGETNIIVRAIDDDGRAQTFQYRLIVQAQ